jgi:hypothetical protein
MPAFVFLAAAWHASGALFAYLKPTFHCFKYLARSKS